MKYPPPKKKKHKREKIKQTLHASLKLSITLILYSNKGKHMVKCSSAWHKVKHLHLIKQNIPTRHRHTPYPQSIILTHNMSVKGDHWVLIDWVSFNNHYRKAWDAMQSCDISMCSEYEIQTSLANLHMSLTFLCGSGNYSGNVPTYL